ncbi:capsid assembly scaffolding protein Gp46 family protein [Anaerosporobacter sp.]|uniref:capsid assembly scaffolding protein Gp46 family protein n=1 Tax=Anaerosporobacter sp. TaxID=1872529 RepID=UPI00286EC27F|nr:DUF4355 domain-containing protein [Anaerosporobacter sp.]
MADESTNKNADPAAEQGTGDKTFTQEDVNRIVGERLAKEKAKTNNDTEISKREQELEQRELRLTAKEVLIEKELPVQLLDALNCTDKKTMEKSIATIETIFNDYKANVTKQTVFKGFLPAGTGTKPTAEVLTGDLEIRKAMGLRT